MTCGDKRTVNDKLLRRWIAIAEKSGWRVRFPRSRGGHVRFLPPPNSGHDPVTVAMTPSGYRSRLNERALLRQRGLEVPRSV